jgi:hemolysin activation/secretion protein
MNQFIYISSCLALLLTSSASNAQPIPNPALPDAGGLMRQVEQNNRQAQLQQAAQQRYLLPPAAALTETTVVTVERFKFNGYKRLNLERLQAVAAPFANKPLNSHDLQQLTEAVIQEYRQAGWMVQAYIPRQNLSGPELTIQLIESIPPNRPQ